MKNFLVDLPWPLVVILVFILTYFASGRKVGTTILVGFCTFFIGFLNPRFWDKAIETTTMVVIGIAICIIIGIVLSIVCILMLVIISVARLLLLWCFISFLYVIQCSIKKGLLKPLQKKRQSNLNQPVRRYLTLNLCPNIWLHILTHNLTRGVTNLHVFVKYLSITF